MRMLALLHSHSPHRLCRLISLQSLSTIHSIASVAYAAFTKCSSAPSSPVMSVNAASLPLSCLRKVNAYLVNCVSLLRLSYSRTHRLIIKGLSFVPYGKGSQNRLSDNSIIVTCQEARRFLLRCSHSPLTFT